MKYPSIEDYFNFIFDDIRAVAYDDIKKPVYEKDKGLSKLEGILEQIKNDVYYPNFFSKAAFLFVSMSTGHYFENGNKRIAMFSFIYFLRINNFRFRSIRKETYSRWLKKNFPTYIAKKFNFRNNIGWALYNFNKAINIKSTQHRQGHSYTFNELKTITEEFFMFMCRR